MLAHFVDGGSATWAHIKGIADGPAGLRYFHSFFIGQPHCELPPHIRPWLTNATPPPFSHSMLSGTGSDAIEPQTFSETAVATVLMMASGVIYVYSVRSLLHVLFTIRPRADC